MNNKRVLVTGGSGFIGLNLTPRLVQAGMNVDCLIRNSSEIKGLVELGVRLIEGDLTGDLSATDIATEDYDWVIHLAGTTNLPSRKRKMQVNGEGTRKLLQTLVRHPRPPVFILVSSLAAAGPSPRGSQLTEESPCQPVSDYGTSKLQAERVAREFAAQIPISIVRPPIVLGPHDREGLVLFRMIRQLGLHVVASYSTHFFSTIHVADLVESLLVVAEKGDRLTTGSAGRGIYFATSDEAPSYCQLGKMIGQAVGRKKVWCIPTPKFSILATGVINSVLNRWLGQRNFLNLDKAREAVAGSWICSNANLKKLGWSPAESLQTRLDETADWYRQQGKL